MSFFKKVISAINIIEAKPDQICKCGKCDADMIDLEKKDDKNTKRKASDEVCSDCKEEKNN